MGKLEDLMLEGMLTELKATLLYAEAEKRATDEGYANVARMFKALSDAEKIHLNLFSRLYYGRDATEEDVENLKGKVGFNVGTTKENLNVCAEVEDETKQYIDAANTAIENGNPGAYVVFTQLAQVGESHANACRNALKHVEKEEDMQPEKIYVCPTCGYIQVGEPPYRCPVCDEPGKNFIKY
ncbi:MAG: ferritin family protein [Candidatus Jordarchaeales archaeon]|nr:rubrerythrin family protein [Candidatus Jordarchaeia archaeon]